MLLGVRVDRPVVRHPEPNPGQQQN